MSSSKRIPVLIQPLDYADIPICSRHAASAFAVDPHTMVKQLGEKPYDMYDMSFQGLTDGLPRKSHIYVKAVDTETDDLVGYASWVFRGVNEEVIPSDGPGDKSPMNRVLNKVTPEVHQDNKGIKIQTSIDRLHALENADIQDWVENQIPANSPCMFINGLIVSPSHQSRGVGSALLQYGNAIADRLGLSIWVHSSHQAYRAYRKAGFEVVRVLDIDLDEYAPREPREGEPVMGERSSGKWGRYTIRYMQRTPKEYG